MYPDNCERIVEVKLKQNIFLTIICLISFFLSNCASLVESLVMDQYRSAGMPEEVLKEKVMNNY